MRIIVVTPSMPRPFGEATARWLHILITGLLTRGHEVVVLVASEEDDAGVSEAKRSLLKSGSWKQGQLTLHCHRLKVDSFMLRRKWRTLVRPYGQMLHDKKLAELLRSELVKGYDVLHLEQMYTGWLGLGVPRVLLNVHFFEAIDCSGKRNMGFCDYKTLWQAQRATSRLLHGIQNVRLLTSRLKQVAESINPSPDARYWVVPFALDTSLYDLQPPAPEPVIGLIGSMHWEPSRSAAERLITRIWPMVKQEFPSAKLLIAGWNAGKYLQKFSSRSDLTLAENLAHPSDFFSQVAVMVYAPARGSGMKVKVMEAMAYGVPVVTTWEGVEGMDYQNGLECWVAESDEDLAAKVCRLLANSGERQQMRDAARRLIEERYSPGPVLDELLSVYQRIRAASPVCMPFSDLKCAV